MWCFFLGFFYSAVYSYASRSAQSRNGTPPHAGTEHFVLSCTEDWSLYSVRLYYSAALCDFHPLSSYSSLFSCLSPPPHHHHHYVLPLLLFILSNRKPRAGSFFWRARFALLPPFELTRGVDSVPCRPPPAARSAHHALPSLTKSLVSISPAPSPISIAGSGGLSNSRSRPLLNIPASTCFRTSTSPAPRLLALPCAGSLWTKWQEVLTCAIANRYVGLILAILSTMAIGTFGSLGSCLFQSRLDVQLKRYTRHKFRDHEKGSSGLE